jgi:hypothetical protein
MSIDIIAASVRVRPKGGQIPKRTVRNQRKRHVRRAWHNVDRHYSSAGSSPTKGRTNSEANRAHPREGFPNGLRMSGEYKNKQTTRKANKYVRIKR